MALRLVLAAAIATTASAAGKCVSYGSTDWSLETAKTTKTACNGANDQWIGGYAQESYGTPTSPKRKTWWTKRLTPTEPRLYFGGPPNEREMKMLYEQGFDAVYSVLAAGSSAFTGNDLEGQPKLAATAAKTAAKAIGLLYGINTDADFKSAASLAAYKKFITFALAQTDGPIYVYCGFGGASSTALQMYRLEKGTLPKSAAGIDQAITEVGYHGIDISAHVAGLEVASNKTKNTALPTVQAGELINDYHWVKYLGKLGNTQFYDAGQIHRKHVDAFKSKVAAVVNMRRSPSDGGIETTNLLNVKNSGGDNSAGTRHNSSFIKANTQYIVDTTRTNGWTVQAGQNFESFNAYEYGEDLHGYNSTLEKTQMDAIADMKYSHLPIGGSWKWTKEALVHYAPEMIAAINHARAKGKHILFHCRTGYRTGAFPTLLLGVISDTASKDMTARLKAVGYDFDLDKPPSGSTTGRVGLLFNTETELEFTGTVPTSATAAITGTVRVKSKPVTKPASASAAVPAVMTALVLAFAFTA